MYEYWYNKKGAVAVIFALILSALLICGIGFIDLNRQLTTRAKLQTLIDAAELSGIGREGDTQERLDAALTSFQHASSTMEGAWSVSANWEENDTVLRLSADGALDPYILSMIGIDTLDISVEAAATASTAVTGGNVCLLLLVKQAYNQTQIVDQFKNSGSSGNARLEAPNCYLYASSNATNPELGRYKFAVSDRCSPIYFKGIITRGSMYQNCSGSNDEERSDLLIEDPFLKADTQYLSSAWITQQPDYMGVCGSNSHNVEEFYRHIYDSAVPFSGNANDGEDYGDGDPDLITLKPGIYCNGLELMGNIKFLPGFYYIIDKFLIGRLGKPLTTVEGEDVTLYLRQINDAPEWRNADISLKAPETGQFGGIVLLSNGQAATTNLTRSGGLPHGKLNCDKGCWIVDNTFADLTGVVYMPRVHLWARSSNPRNRIYEHDWTSWVLWGAHFEGGSIKFNFPPNGVSAQPDYPEPVKELVSGLIPNEAQITSSSVRLIE